MVTWESLCRWTPLVAWADSQTQPLIMRLSPQHRAVVILALVAIVLVGIALMALVVVAGRYVLREVRRANGPTPRYEDGWYRKPLAPRDGDISRDGHS